MTTNTKAVSARIQNEIIRNYGGKRLFKKYVDDFTYGYSENRYQSYAVGVKELIQQNPPHIYYWDQYQYLKRTIPGFKPDSYHYKSEAQGRKYGLPYHQGGKTYYLKTERVFEVYSGLMTREGIRLYEKIRKEHPEW